MAQTMQLNQFNQTPIIGNTATKVNLNTLPVTIDPNSTNTLFPGDAVYLTTTTANQIYVDKWASGLGTIFGFILYNVKGTAGLNTNGLTANEQTEIGLSGTIMFGQAGSTISRGQMLEYQSNVAATGPQMIPSAGVNPVSGIALDNAASTGVFRFMVLFIPEAGQQSVFTLAAVAGNNTVNPASTGDTIYISATASMTLNASTVLPGRKLQFIINNTTSATLVITFGTNFRAAGTLATPAVAGKIVTIQFLGDGTTSATYDELSRISLTVMSGGVAVPSGSTGL